MGEGTWENSWRMDRNLPESTLHILFGTAWRSEPGGVYFRHVPYEASIFLAYRNRKFRALEMYGYTGSYIGILSTCPRYWNQYSEWLHVWGFFGWDVSTQKTTESRKHGAAGCLKSWPATQDAEIEATWAIKIALSHPGWNLLCQ